MAIEIECIPSGLKLACRGIKTGDIHDALHSMGQGGTMTKDPQGRDRAKTGHLAAEMLALSLVPPYVVHPGPYSSLQVGEMPDLREVMVTDVLSAIYQLRARAGTPIETRPNCQHCGRIPKSPLQISAGECEHFECSEEGKTAITEEGGLFVTYGPWKIEMCPPIIRRSSALDRILDGGEYPPTLGCDSMYMASIKSVARTDGVGIWGQKELSPEQKKMAGDLAGEKVEDKGTGEERPQVDIQRKLTILTDIVRWWYSQEDWGLLDAVRDKGQETWGDVDTFYNWTCSVDPTVCHQEQEGGIPLGPGFFGISVERARKRRKKGSGKKPGMLAGPQS